MKSAITFVTIAVMAAMVHSGEVTKMLETLEGNFTYQGMSLGDLTIASTMSDPGYEHFSNIRVFIDQPNCADGNPEDICSLEGYRFPCCHVHRGTDVKGYMTMISEEDTVDNGLITCEVGVGSAPFDHMCLEPEFCNGLNTTCPLAGPRPVKYNFAFSTDYWGRTHVSFLSQ